MSDRGFPTSCQSQGSLNLSFSFSDSDLGKGGCDYEERCLHGSGYLGFNMCFGVQELSVVQAHGLDRSEDGHIDLILVWIVSDSTVVFMALRFFCLHSRLEGWILHKTLFFSNR